ncbi:AAA domain-containing protein [Myxozyma melibiosi]|uniref:Adenylate kinase isoenzyme 6 homolog n=1 Tax=Myxozyma melibiosi TaxID=54550 RepID=A0ABR1F5G8_9ASCO
MRSLPNIIVTGTPGTGKSTHCKRLAELLPEYTYLSINQFITDNKLQDGRDEERNSVIANEDKLVELIRPDLKKGGRIIDWHVCDIFPESLIDLVVVMRTDTTRLYDRLKERGYTGTKFDDNMDSEIMEVILTDAREAYAPEIVIELQSNSVENVVANSARIVEWAKQWVIDNTREDGGSEESESESESGSGSGSESESEGSEEEEDDEEDEEDDE